MKNTKTQSKLSPFAIKQRIKVRFLIPQFISQALYNDKKYTCIAAGRRTGKTYNSAQWLLENLLYEKGKAGLWVDTTQRNLSEYVDIYFKKILGEVWQYCKYDKQAHRIDFPSGSFLHLRSAERPENMEGFEYDYIVCNEAGIIFKTSELWQNTIMPMAKNAQVKLVGTPKGKNYFETLFNAQANSDEWESWRFSAYDSPYWTPEQLEAIKKDPSITEEIWEQEYEGKFVAGDSFAICQGQTNDSWRDKKDIPYSIEHDWIQKQLNDEGYYFVAFDGGMQTTHSAAVLGFRNLRYSRDILLKEFFNRLPHERIKSIAIQVQDFCTHHSINISDLRLFGDPALTVYGDDNVIQGVLNKKVNCLQSLKESESGDIRNIWANRKTNRLNRLAEEMTTTKSDNKPAVILLKNGTPGATFSYGCPNIYQGLFEGMFRFEVVNGIRTNDIEQVPPITDLCDAYSYYLLATRPRAGTGKKDIKLEDAILG